MRRASVTRGPEVTRKAPSGFCSSHKAGSRKAVGVLAIAVGLLISARANSQAKTSAEERCRDNCDANLKACVEKCPSTDKQCEEACRQVYLGCQKECKPSEENGSKRAK
jgi:hypothetical protein